MVWWLMEECFSAIITPLWLTTPSGECVAVKFGTIVSYLLISTNHCRFKLDVVVNETVFSTMIRPLRLTTPSVECVAMKLCTFVSYLLIFTNHRRFKHGVVVNETVFFGNDKTITAYYSSC